MYVIHPSLFMQLATLSLDSNPTPYFVKSVSTPNFIQLTEISTAETDVKLVKNFTNEGTEIAFSETSSLVIMRDGDQQKYRIHGSEFERIVIQAAAKKIGVI